MQIWEVPYDAEGFRPIGRHMRLFGGGGGKAAAPAPGSMTKMATTAIGTAAKRSMQQAKSPSGAIKPTSLLAQSSANATRNASPSLRDTALKNTLLGE